MMRERLSEFAEDLRWGSRRALGRLGPEESRSPEARRVFRHRRIAAVVVLLLALFAVFELVPVPGIPCDVSPAKTCAPPDHAIDFVPASADAYVHFDLDPGSSQYSTAAGLAGKLPHAAEVEQGLLDALRVQPRIVLSAVSPWVGNEAAVAELAGPHPRSLVLLAVRDRAAAHRYLAGLERGRSRTVSDGGVAVHVYASGIAYADLPGFIAIGEVPAVRLAIDTYRGRGNSLAQSPQANSLRESLPTQRIADAYLTPPAAKRLLSGRTGLAAQADKFVDFAATNGVAAALVAHGNGFELQLSSSLNPTSKGQNPSFFGPFPSFHPSLAGEFPPDTFLYLDVANPADTAPVLLRAAQSAAPALAGSLAALSKELRGARVNLQGDLLPALGDEAAIGVSSGAAGPSLTAAFGGVDEQGARAGIARLQAPLISALSPARTGQAPSLGVKRVGGTDVRTLRLTPTLTIAYAIFDGKAVISTDPAVVHGAVTGADDLAGTDGYKAAASGTSGGTSALVFVDLEGLVKRAEPLGLGQVVGRFGADLARLKAIGLTVHSDAHDLKTTLFLNID